VNQGTTDDTVTTCVMVASGYSWRKVSLTAE
jgi:hypothetical protein